MPPTRHSPTEMHRSTHDTTGASIAASKVLVTDGSGGFTYEDFDSGLFIRRLDFGPENFFDHGAVGATETIDGADGNVHWITLDANCTLTFTGAVASIDGQAVHSGFLLYVEQDGTGGWDLTLPGSVVDGAALSAALDQTASTLSRIVFTTPDGGTTWYGDIVGGSGATELTVEDEGTPLATAADTLNFVGAGVTASGTTNEKTITIPGVTEANVQAVGHYEVMMDGSSPPNPLENGSGTDWLYVWVYP